MQFGKPSSQQENQIYCKDAGRHKVRGRTDGILRPKKIYEAKIDEIYDPINIGLLRKMLSLPQTPIKQTKASKVHICLWNLKTHFGRKKFKYVTQSQNFGKIVS